MKYADKMEYSNIQLYEVGDMQCENLALKAMKAGIKTIVVTPSSLPAVNRILGKNSDVKVDVAIAYPSGAYFSYQKVQEIEGLLRDKEHFDEIYVVMQVGKYLSGHPDVMKEEISAVAAAARNGNIPVKLVTEAALLSDEQMKEICDTAAENKLKAIVASTGFLPYDVPLPDTDDNSRLVKTAGGRLEVIACGNITKPDEFLAMLDAGADKVCTTMAYEILMELNEQ
jgi:deoxyribose-phosphate aldolase